MEQNAGINYQEALEKARTDILLFNFQPEKVVENLIKAGLDEDRAKVFVSELVVEKENTFIGDDDEPQPSGERKLTAFFILFIISGVSVLSNIDSPVLYLIVACIGGFAGYYGYPHKPWAGILSISIAAIAFPYFFHMYFSGRERFIVIELFIPMILAALPAIFVMLSVTEIFYPTKKEQEESK